MSEWIEVTQAMIDWLENNLTETQILLKMSDKIGYSPYYCSAQFHRTAKTTIKNYVAGRRLCKAAIDLRDTGERIIDIAVKHGYSSQEALTRAFVSAYGRTPAAYRKNPCPINLVLRQDVSFPHNKRGEGDIEMSKFCLREPAIRMEYIPAHKYIGIWEEKAAGYCDFWDYHGCDEVCGIIESMRNVSDPVVGCHMAGWCKTDGKKSYFYGLGVPADYTGPVPKGFEIKEFPASYYMVFFHPAFDYMNDNVEVMTKVEALAWNYDLTKRGVSDAEMMHNASGSKLEWNEDECQCYQRHFPEILGYEVLRPVKILR